MINLDSFFVIDHHIVAIIPIKITEDKNIICLFGRL